jgi:hypothetical protein
MHSNNDHDDKQIDLFNNDYHHHHHHHKTEGNNNGNCKHPSDISKTLTKIASSLEEIQVTLHEIPGLLDTQNKLLERLAVSHVKRTATLLNRGGGTGD